MIDNKVLKGACLVGQSGGPSAVINASLYGLVKCALENENITKVYGAVNGIKGLLKGKIIDFSKEAPEELELLPTTPSSSLGSCRYKLNNFEDDESEYMQIVEIFKEYDIKFFFYIGGNDSMDTCEKLGRYFEQIKFDCKVIGVPKTIDNDVHGTDHTPGYGSAAKYVASTIMELYQDAVVYDTPQVVVVEIMGRNAGWLTAAAALASHYGDGPDFVCLPEITFDLNDFMNKIEDRVKYDKNVIIAISEGVKDANGKYISDYALTDDSIDAFGHTQMGGLALYLVSLIKQRMNVKARAIELSLLQRCAAHMASKQDQEDAILVGKTAVEQALLGKSGYMICLNRISDEPYQCVTELVPLSKAANYEKKIPLNWIREDGYGVTDDFIKYATPLIKGETDTVYENGLPRFARLKKELAKN